MKFTRISVILLFAAFFVVSCKKTEDTDKMRDSTAAAITPEDSAKNEAAKWAAFKADAKLRIQALQDSVDAYDARMKAANPHYRADVKARESIKRRSTALKARLEEKDEAVGSWGRMKDAIVGGIDTLATGVGNVVSPKKK